MMSTQYIYFIIFFCIGYLIVTDNSVAKFVFYLSRLAALQYEKIKWWILYSPDNPIVRLAIRRNSEKMAKELMKEMQNK